MEGLIAPAGELALIRVTPAKKGLDDLISHKKEDKTMANEGEVFFRCKKCGGDTKFPSIKELRIHQWAEHREAYENTVIAAKKRLEKVRNKRGRGGNFGSAWRKKISEGRRRGIAARKKAAKESQVPSVKLSKARTLAAVQAAMNGDMRVADLLEELQRQKTFINDVYSLVSEMAGQYERTKEDE